MPRKRMSVPIVITRELTPSRLITYPCTLPSTAADQNRDTDADDRAAAGEEYRTMSPSEDRGRAYGQIELPCEHRDTYAESSDPDRSDNLEHGEYVLFVVAKPGMTMQRDDDDDGQRRSSSPHPSRDSRRRDRMEMEVIDVLLS